MQWAAYNMRFGKIAALPPQKVQCEFGSYYPARSLVKPLPRQAAPPEDEIDSFIPNEVRNLFNNLLKF